MFKTSLLANQREGGLMRGTETRIGYSVCANCGTTSDEYKMIWHSTPKGMLCGDCHHKLNNRKAGRQCTKCHKSLPMGADFEQTTHGVMCMECFQAARRSVGNDEKFAWLFLGRPMKRESAFQRFDRQRAVEQQTDALARRINKLLEQSDE